MQCPWCVLEGERSTIRVTGGFVTAMGWSPYYDEDGNYHTHDPNGTGTNCWCSRGHHFIPAAKGCPSCDEMTRDAVLVGVRCAQSETETDLAPTSDSNRETRCPDCGERAVVYTFSSPDKSQRMLGEHYIPASKAASRQGS